LADSSSSVIDEIAREGARRMLAEAVRAEVDAYCARFADLRDENGYRLVVRNGLYLHGLWSGDFAAALGQFGSTQGYGGDHHQDDRDLAGRAEGVGAWDLSHVDYAYAWADGIHFNLRLDEAKLCPTDGVLEPAASFATRLWWSRRH
jgi:hypothetical protein